MGNGLELPLKVDSTVSLPRRETAAMLTGVVAAAAAALVRLSWQHRNIANKGLSFRLSTCCAVGTYVRTSQHR